MSNRNSPSYGVSGAAMESLEDFKRKLDNEHTTVSAKLDQGVRARQELQELKGKLVEDLESSRKSLQARVEKVEAKLGATSKLKRNKEDQAMLPFLEAPPPLPPTGSHSTIVLTGFGGALGHRVRDPGWQCDADCVVNLSRGLHPTVPGTCRPKSCLLDVHEPVLLLGEGAVNFWRLTLPRRPWNQQLEYLMECLEEAMGNLEACHKSRLRLGKSHCSQKAPATLPKLPSHRADPRPDPV